jgi:hypothetical protein
MCLSKDGRTTSDRKYRPIRRSVSRYGILEKVLNELKDECEKRGTTKVSSQVVAHRVKIFGTRQVQCILRFTIGIKKEPGRGGYEFTGEPIRVDAG